MHLFFYLVLGKINHFMMCLNPKLAGLPCHQDQAVQPGDRIVRIPPEASRPEVQRNVGHSGG
jgi:hypothetical protein